MVIARGPITAALQALLVAGTQRPCGVAQLPTVPAPGGGMVPAAVPYNVLYPMGGPVSGPPFGDASADASVTWQVTSVADRADQAEWLADRTRAVLVGRTGDHWTHQLTLSGVSVMNRRMTDDAGVIPEGATVTYVQRVTLDLTPTA